MYLRVEHLIKDAKMEIKTQTIRDEEEDLGKILSHTQTFGGLGC